MLVFLLVFASKAAQGVECVAQLNSIEEPAQVFLTVKALVHQELQQYKLQSESLQTIQDQLKNPDYDLNAVLHYMDAVIEVIDVVQARLQRVIILNAKLRERLRPQDQIDRETLSWQSATYDTLSYHYTQLRAKLASKYNSLTQSLQDKIPEEITLH